MTLLVHNLKRKGNGKTILNPTTSLSEVQWSIVLARNPCHKGYQHSLAPLNVIL